MSKKTQFLADKMRSSKMPTFGMVTWHMVRRSHSSPLPLSLTWHVTDHISNCIITSLAIFCTTNLEKCTAFGKEQHQNFENTPLIYLLVIGRSHFTENRSDLVIKCGLRNVIENVKFCKRCNFSHVKNHYQDS